MPPSLADTLPMASSTSPTCNPASAAGDATLTSSILANARSPAPGSCACAKGCGGAGAAGEDTPSGADEDGTGDCLPPFVDAPLCNSCSSCSICFVSALWSLVNTGGGYCVGGGCVCGYASLGVCTTYWLCGCDGFAQLQRLCLLVDIPVRCLMLMWNGQHGHTTHSITPYLFINQCILHANAHLLQPCCMLSYLGFYSITSCNQGLDSAASIGLTNHSRTGNKNAMLLRRLK